MERTGFILDSHVLIWALYEQARLPLAHRVILDGDVETWISAATIWEVEIKKAAGKLPIPDSIWEQASEVGHRFLPIEPRHAKLAGSLPLHHGDPFDRMLIAQARIEGLTILTVDKAFRDYEVAVR